MQLFLVALINNIFRYKLNKLFLLPSTIEIDIVKIRNKPENTNEFTKGNTDIYG